MEGLEKTVHLPLKFKYYNMIESGAKRIEYRNKNDYWRHRLLGATHARLRKGYTKESMLFRITKVLTLRKVYAIYYGERLE